jgi:hypothetical protein
MPVLRFLPLRQKIMLGLTLIAGIMLMVSVRYNLLSQYINNELIFFYSVGIPFMLLLSDYIIDLNQRPVFICWLALAFVCFIICLLTYGDDQYIIIRSSRFDQTSVINSFFSKYSTSALKAPLVFLLIYWILNKLLNKRGLFLVNSFKQKSWYHEPARREITGLDVVFNMLLYVSIFIAGLF